jgi:acetyltransferase-like isoleucine patch superfamily enzyme
VPKDARGEKLPAGQVRLRLDAEELAALREAARARGTGVDELLTRLARSYLVPATTLEAEADLLGPHLPTPPLERLAPPLRLGVRAVGETVRWGWTLAGRRRYRIGRGLITNGRLRLGGPGRIDLGRDVNAWARSGMNLLMTHRPEARIVVGDRVRLNGAAIQAATLIEIGDDAILASCFILDTDHHAADPSLREVAVPTRRVRIGRGAWIAGAVVLKGVSVGDGSVVGSGSVVTADVPDHVVVAGNPARVVRRLDG